MLETNGRIDKIHLVAVGKNRNMFNLEEYDELVNDLNLKIVNFTTIQAANSFLCDPNFKVDIISIDIEYLFDQDGIGMWDFISTIYTVIKMTSYFDGENLIPRNTKIVAGVTKESNLNQIKDVISNVDILGLGPRLFSFTFEEVKLGIREIIAGKCHVPKYIQERLHPKKKQESKIIVSKNEIKLTGRQQQILDMVSNRGASNKMIAKTLDISESTVKLHVGTILKKFGARNRTQLAIFGKKHSSQV